MGCMPRLRVGTPLWLLDLATGGEWFPTAVLAHVSGVVIGFVGVQRLGLPRRVAFKALAAYVPLWALTRAVTPPSANVNVAFSVYQGWQTWFTSYPAYFVMLLGFGLVTLIAAEQMLALIGRTSGRCMDSTERYRSHRSGFGSARRPRRRTVVRSRRTLCWDYRTAVISIFWRLGVVNIAQPPAPVDVHRSVLQAAQPQSHRASPHAANWPRPRPAVASRSRCRVSTSAPSGRGGDKLRARQPDATDIAARCLPRTRAHCRCRPAACGSRSSAPRSLRGRHSLLRGPRAELAPAMWRRSSSTGADRGRPRFAPA